MSIKESMLNLWGKVRQGPVMQDSTEANLLNGGHTGYHPPVQPRPTRKQAAQQAAYDPNFYQKTGFQQDYQGNGPLYQQPNWQQYGYQNPGAQGFAGQTGYAPAGQTGMAWQSVQPTSGWQAQQTGFAANQQTGFAASQQTGFAANQQTGFAASQQTGFAASQQTGFAASQQTGFAAGQQGAGFGQGQATQDGRGTYRTDGNVTYAFGQQFRGQDGVAYSHVERLAQPLSVATCFRLIEFMRNGESIIVNLELISDESERTRCLDMLCGAAFTMECTFNRVASRCIYLIAPRNVQVLPYESIRQMNEQDQEDRWPREEGGVRTDVRWSERRSARQSANAAGDERRYSYSW